MTYVYVHGGQIAAIGELDAAMRLDDHSFISAPVLPKELLEEAGWFLVADVTMPAESLTHRHIVRYELVDGVPVMVWDAVPKGTEEVNGGTLRQRAVDAMEDNRTFINTASPSNAQAVAQVKDLSRQMNGVIRLVLHKLDGTD